MDKWILESILVWRFSCSGQRLSEAGVQVRIRPPLSRKRATWIGNTHPDVQRLRSFQDGCLQGQHGFSERCGFSHLLSASRENASASTKICVSWRRWHVPILSANLPRGRMYCETSCMRSIVSSRYAASKSMWTSSSAISGSKIQWTWESECSPSLLLNVVKVL